MTLCLVESSCRDGQPYCAKAYIRVGESSGAAVEEDASRAVHTRYTCPTLIEVSTAQVLTEQVLALSCGMCHVRLPHLAVELLHT
jgi:hypothetical protein